ncbi:cellulase family glycosylhydrolase [Aquimarina agarivorans]|uniref:cellulase family glycosylhydrolase n=1 Tax=Aquimarina agarivorans TaxID=980584 RepID=UPI000248F62C|nr:cellulase family glycosylhydrolase [Aquimarina agarivorans]
MIKKTTLFSMISAALMSFGTIQAQGSCEQNWLTAEGNTLVDAAGNEVILAGVNWFGLETQISIPHGLYARDVDGMLMHIKQLGFNSIRLPWHNGMLREGASFQAPNFWVKDPISYNGTPAVGPFSNLALQNMTKPLEIMDYIVDWCQENDLKIILDCHSRNPDAYLIEKLWYTETTSEEQWIKDWVFLADRYKDKSAVIGMDINNEPNGKIDNPAGARWGTGDEFDWRLASEKCGNAILEVNPNVLIMVEGIEAYRKPNGDLTSYWWGGNLQGARDFPVRLSNPKKLMYSPHEYGPTVFDQVWFSDPEFPENMPAIWEEQFNFLNTNGTSPLLIGELGIKGSGGKDEIWFQKFIDFIKEKKLHYTFWAMNPNSGDTGGILANDWISVVQWKMDYLKPILSNPIPNCISLSGEPTLSTPEFEDLFNEQMGVSLSPNPTRASLEVVSSKELIESITVYNLLGSEVLLFENVDDFELKISVRALASGVYVVKTVTTSGIYTSKLMRN